jgi:hypothetical protein
MGFFGQGMSDSNSSSPASARSTLKLKVARKVSPPPAKAPPLPQPPRQAAQKFGATWADEYKARMQADMDALATRGKD